MSELSSSQLHDLSQIILKDRDPAVRKEALLEIRQSNHPRVLELLQYVSTKDKDRSVRDLAGNLLTKKKIQGIQQPEPARSIFEPAAVTSSGPGRTISDTRSWMCKYCRAENVGGETCPNCGATRPAESQPVKTGVASAIRTDEVFLMNPYNRAFMEGKSKSFSSTNTKGVACLLIFLIPFVVIGIGTIAWAVSALYSWNAINQSGVAVTGEITGKHISSGDDSDTYYVSYRYAHDGTDYSHQQSVDWNTYQNAEIGARVNILYVPSSPNIASLADKNDPPYIIVGFSLFWNLIIWGILISTLVGRSRDNLLAKEGQLVRGEVMTSKISIEGEDKDFYLKVEYAFHAPADGRLITGHAKVQRNDLRKNNTTLPPPGTPLAILYRNDTHHRPL